MLYRPKVLLIADDLIECNSTALLAKAPKYITEKFEIVFKLKNEVDDINVENFDIVINSNDVFLPTKYQINVEFSKIPFGPSKRMDRNISPSIEYTKFEDLYVSWRHVDIILSNSAVNSVLFNACNGATAEQYQITGIPSNDFLFDEVVNKNNILETFGVVKDRDFKVIMYSYDYTTQNLNYKGMKGLNELFQAIFNFEKFEINELFNFLKKNKLFFFIDMTKNNIYISEYNKNMLLENNIFLLKENDLVKRHLYLSQILNAIDLLISDVNPSCLNYFLLNKPVLFNDNRLSHLEGGPIHPYQFWSPGSRFKLYTEMESMILAIFEKNDSFAAERKKIVDIVHHHQTAGSSERAWHIIDHFWECGNTSIEKLELSAEQNDIKIAITDRIGFLIENNSLEDAQNAIEAYKEHFEIDEEYITMQSFLYFKLGESKKALQILKEGRLKFPNNYDILFNLGYISQELGQKEMSKYYFDMARQNQTGTEI
ncbi:CDP-glycerol glycerophosphotransferase family protein [Paenibacillus sp. BIC5C1]|uniref:CDP-glycerol glycerophosphotransferase family protein n=1 Tax=Paenibacillus sp. BIC5C1 TaxID=3078263 RepID=UPI0028E72861|nr:CDP-glycerol glycerophosphotransferase family protein [Paenibacillus sp. BIC5C1]